MSTAPARAALDSPHAKSDAAPAPIRRNAAPIPENETPQMLRRTVLRLAWPSIVENLLQSAMQIATTAMVSRLGAAAIAGVGVSNQILIVGISTFFAVSTATTVLVAFHIGAREPDQAARAAKQSYFLGGILSLVAALLGVFFAPQLIAVLGASPEVVAEGGQFLRIESLGTIFLVTMLISSGIMRGTGDTRTPMLVTLGINGVNVIVSLPLIFGLLGLPHLGVTGAAIGNIVARMIGATILVSFVWRGRRGVSIAGREGWKPDLVTQRKLIGIGLPSMLESLFRSGGTLLFATVIVSLGTQAFAAQQVANQFWQMALFPGFGFSTAAMTLSGQSLGARRLDRAAAATWIATRFCILWMTAMGIVYFVFGPWLVIPFSAGDPHITELSSQALKIICFSQPIQALGLTLAGGLRGAGDTRWPMFSTGIGMWLMRVPGAYFFGVILGLGIPGAYIGLILDAILVAALNLWRYRSGRWQTTRTLAAAPAR